MSSNYSGLATHEQAVQSTGTWPRQPVAKWRENPERLAWIVILASFIVFLFLAISIPLSVRYIVRNATVSQEARLEATLGTLLLYPTETSEPIAITNARDDIAEGSRIIAGDELTQGTLGLVGTGGLNEVLGSVQIYPGTVLEVLRVRRPFFGRSTEPYSVRLRLPEGRARIFTNSGSKRALDVALETPHGVIELAEGSYQVSVDAIQTDITVRSGRAILAHQDERGVPVESGLRAWMTTDALAQEPVPAEQNLLRNGDFTEPMLNTWQSYVVADNVAPGSVRVIEREGRWVAYFMRQGEEGAPNEVGIVQTIGKDVNVYDSLKLRLDVKLLHQSLPGAGYLSSEFPLRVEITYTDIYGKSLPWGHGFYTRDPENENWRVDGGQKIPAYTWYTYESPNLLELLSDTRPARIDSVRIYASGWNYQSMASEVYLTVE